MMMMMMMLVVAVLAVLAVEWRVLAVEWRVAVLAYWFPFYWTNSILARSLGGNPGAAWLLSHGALGRRGSAGGNKAQTVQTPKTNSMTMRHLTLSWFQCNSWFSHVPKLVRSWAFRLGILDPLPVAKSSKYLRKILQHHFEKSDSLPLDPCPLHRCASFCGSLPEDWRGGSYVWRWTLNINARKGDFRANRNSSIGRKILEELLTCGNGWTLDFVWEDRKSLYMWQGFSGFHS